MKLLFVINQFYKGGAETALLNLLKQINDGTNEIDLMIMNQCGAERAISLIEQVPKEVHVLDILQMQKKLSLKDKIRAKYLLTSKEKYCDPPAALLYARDHTYDWAFHVGEWWIPAFTALKVRAERKALWIHSDLTKAISFQEDKFFLYDDRITKYIFVSQNSMQSCVDKYPFIKKKAECIYNILNVHAIKELALESVDEDYFARGLPVIVTCANVRPEKNHRRQLRAMQILKKRGVDFIWLNIGSTNEWDRCEKLREDARAFSLEDRFILAGARDNPYKYMNRAKAVTVLSDYESWSLVITEAKILGIPVISTKTSGGMEQIVHEETGLLTDFNAIDIADKIEMLFRSCTLQEKIRNNLRGFDLTDKTMRSFREMMFSKLENSIESDHKLIYVMDDVNYPSGATSATVLQIKTLLSEGKHISVFSGNIPSTKTRIDLNGVCFLGWNDCPENMLYHRRLLDCLLDSKLSETAKKYKFRMSWDAKKRKYENIFDEWVLPRLTNLFSEYETICVPFENSVFRTVVGESTCSRKIQWIHIDYCAWRNCSEWAKKVTANDGDIYKNFDKIVVLTEAIREEFVKLYPHLETKMFVNANLLPQEEIRKKALPENEESRYIHFITVARIDKQKGFERLYEMLLELYNSGYRFYWTIVGGGEDFEKIHHMFASSVLATYVTMTGPLSNPFYLVKKADVFALLSIYEGLPNTIYESMILGTPVIATNVGGISTQITENENGWLVENSENGIFEGIAHILEHPEEISRFRDNLKSYKYENEMIYLRAKEILYGQGN